MFERTKNNVMSVIFVVALVLFIIAASIALPIYWRDFYYFHVDVFNMPEETGYTREEIVEAFDEVMDYLTVKGTEFGTGVLKYSEEGKSHFEDCKALFDLNTYALIFSVSVLILLIIVDKIGLISLARPCGFRLSFWASIVTLGLFGLLGVIVASDFDSAFTVFHQLFFPGKDNWVFDPRTDEIIRVLPQSYFMSCATLICASVIILSIVFIIRAIIKRSNDYAWRI